MDLPNAAAAHEKDKLDARMDRRGKRMDGHRPSELADLAIRERRLEKLRVSGAVRSEDQSSPVRRKRALQKVGRMTDGRVIRQLTNRRAGRFILVLATLRRMPRSLAEGHLKFPGTNCGRVPALRSSGQPPSASASRNHNRDAPTRCGPRRAAFRRAQSPKPLPRVSRYG